MSETPFVYECRKALCKLPGFSDLSRPRKELYRELVMGSASDPLSERHGWGGRRRRSAPIGIERQDRASWTILNSRLHGDLHGTRCPFSAWTSERTWQRCPIVLAAAVAWKKRLSTPSTTAIEFARSGITSGSGRLTSNPRSSCWSTLVTS